MSTVSDTPTKFLLTEDRIPTHWVNLLPDLPGAPLPPLHPGTMEPAGPPDLTPIFPMALIEQEVSASPDVEIPAQNPEANYSLGSVLNHVLLHQTVIGQETIAQMEMAGEAPDVVVGCVGGGSNFAGLAYPWLRRNLREGANVRFVAAEPAACPKKGGGARGPPPPAARTRSWASCARRAPGRSACPSCGSGGSPTP